MKRRKPQRKIPLVRLIGLEATLVAAGAAPSPAAAAPGDLDPSFGDAGRHATEYPFPSNLWSVDVQDDDSVLLGGGGEYCYFGCYEQYFVGRVLANGTPDAGFAAAVLEHTVVYDTALQSDGKVVGVGRSGNSLQVFRLRPDGALDPGFGLGGITLVSDGGDIGYVGHAVDVDPDGRIVVAGARGANLLVARLQPGGALDPSFATGGIFVGAQTYTLNRIARNPGGGYRVLVNGVSSNPVAAATEPDCRVVGLTEAGVLDAAFGTNGTAAPAASGGRSVHCASLAIQSDGRILLGGVEGAVDGYTARLLPGGAIDPAFSTATAGAHFDAVTALATGTAGKVFVAGTDRNGLSGALVVRLLSDGSLDPVFGRGGMTRVDVRSPRAAAQVVRDLKVTRNGGLVLGGNPAIPYSSQQFVARLLGDGGGSSPGVLGMTMRRVVGGEQGEPVVVTVQRTGGTSGAVAVTFKTLDFPAPPDPNDDNRAIGGADYTATTGRLAWADGEAGEREIVVPLAADTVAEPPEYFEVVLEAPEGGAGLGATGVDVEVGGEGYPAGQFSLQLENPTVTEGGQATVVVNRNYYTTGAVAVTLRLAGGTAVPGDDFGSPGSADAWQDVVLTWADGDPQGKVVAVPTRRDKRNEDAETVVLEIATPTGGAAVGAQSTATLTIADGVRTGSGGGRLDWLGTALLSVGAMLRRRWIPGRGRRSATKMGGWIKLLPIPALTTAAARRRKVP